MESDNLYRVQEEDLPRLQKLLTVCFAQDPLYHTLIPDDNRFFGKWWLFISLFLDGQANRR